MLQDLSAGHYATSNVTSHITSNNSNAADYSVYSDFGSFTNVPSNRPPQRNHKVRSDTSSHAGGSLKVPRRPPHPPKLQHILKTGSEKGRNHDLIKATPR